MLDRMSEFFLNSWQILTIIMPVVFAFLSLMSAAYFVIIQRENKSVFRLIKITLCYLLLAGSLALLHIRISP